MKRTLLITSFGLGLLVSSAQAASLQYHAVLTGAAEVPPVTTAGSGELFATLDTATRQLTYTLSFAGLSGPAAAAHFHGPAKASANAGVVVPITLKPDAPIHGTATLTEAQVKELMEGIWYVNVHTAANKGGEIRGQVMQSR